MISNNVTPDEKKRAKRRLSQNRNFQEKHKLRDEAKWGFTIFRESKTARAQKGSSQYCREKPNPQPHFHPLMKRGFLAGVPFRAHSVTVQPVQVLTVEIKREKVGNVIIEVDYKLKTRNLIMNLNHFKARERGKVSFCVYILLGSVGECP